MITTESLKLDMPFVRAVTEATEKIVAGWDVYQKFVCRRCGAALSMAEANCFYTKGTCDRCGAATDIQADGCGYYAVKPEIQTETVMVDRNDRPTFQRRHYKALADVIVKAKKRPNDNAAEAVNDLERDLAAMLRRDNPAFPADQFHTDCTVPTPAPSAQTRSAR